MFIDHLLCSTGFGLDFSRVGRGLRVHDPPKTGCKIYWRVNLPGGRVPNFHQIFEGKGLKLSFQRGGGTGGVCGKLELTGHDLYMGTNFTDTQCLL